MMDTDASELEQDPEQEVIEDLRTAANAAYHAVGERYGLDPDEIYKGTDKRSYCIEVSEEMKKHLITVIKKGYTEETVQAVDSSYMFVDHRYLLLRRLNKKPLIADPTWQFFLPKEQRTPDKPKVLIGTPEQLPHRLVQYGLHPEQTIPWGGPPR